MGDKRYLCIYGRGRDGISKDVSQLLKHGIILIYNIILCYTP